MLERLWYQKKRNRPNCGEIYGVICLAQDKCRDNRSDIGGSTSSPFEEITEKLLAFFGFPFGYQHSPAAVSSFSSSIIFNETN